MTCYRIILPDASELLADVPGCSDFRSIKMALELEVFMLVGMSVDIVRIFPSNVVLTKWDKEDL